jgi:hypothetical protein
MHKSKLVVALGAVVALTAAPLMTSTAASASSGSNSGTAVTRGAPLAAPTGHVSAKKFKPIAQPGKSKYTKKTCKFDLSGIADFTQVSSLEQCGQTVTISPTTEKRSVPGSWATWGSPPDTEDAFPHILYTVGATSVTLKFSKASKIGGIEAEPNPFEVHSFDATFSKGSKARGTVHRDDVDGNAGAKLLAAKSKKKWDTITISSDVDFSFGQIRVSK